VADRGASDVAGAIADEIARTGPIGFDRFMELALYGPGGFFQREASRVGPDADFVTSPHVHPYVFSRCVRAAVLDAWAALGEPDPLAVVDLGAGDGTFPAALRDALSELPSPAVDVTAVEIAEPARVRAGERGIAAVPTVDDLAPFEGVAFANELLDNLPFLLARRDGGRLREVRVATHDGTFVREEVPWHDERIGSSELTSLVDGEEASVPVGAASLLRSLAERLRGGYAIIVDYGFRGRSGRPHGYARHREVDDVLADPGAADITAGLDVDLVARLAASAGLRAFDPVTQAGALRALGLDRWDTAMRERQAELQRDGDRSAAVRVWGSRGRASILVDPARLGALWWIVLATPGLPPPSWLPAALEIDAGR
jgi:SAM-dependent MidA family methyltransferase